MVSSSSLASFQVFSYFSINFMDSLILFSYFSSSSTTTTYLLKFDHSFSVQGVCGVVKDLLLGFLKAKGVQCKCTIRNKDIILENA